MYIVINHISIVVVKIIDTKTMDLPRDIQLEFFEYNKNRTKRYVFSDRVCYNDMGGYTMKDVNLLISNGVEVYSSLELFGDMETYDATLQDFLDAVDRKMADIKRFKEMADMSNYAIQVHSLKSDAKYLGFTRLAEIAYNHEMESKANNSMFIYEHYDELVAEANRIIDLVRTYLGVGGTARTIQAEAVIPTGKKILVVDDSNLIRNIITKMFNGEFEVLAAIDGAQALNIINDPSIQLYGILLDLYMPNVNGFAVLEYFKQNNLFSKVPVAIITGDTSIETTAKAMAYPIVDVLTKPFNENNIRKVMKAMENFQKVS